MIKDTETRKATKKEFLLQERNSIFPKPHISPFLHAARSPWASPQGYQSRALPLTFSSPFAAPQVSPGLGYSSSVKKACDACICLAVLFSDKQQSRQLMWDVDSLCVRQGAAATCWHPVT